MKVKINNRFYDFFDEVEINRSVASVASTFSLRGKFDPNNKFHKEIFKPLSYNIVKIYNYNDILIFTGYTLNNSFRSSSNPQLQNISGYSKTGILEDVNIDVDNYPLEKNNISLREITQIILKPYGLDFQVSNSIYSRIIEPTSGKGIVNDMDKIYDTTVADPDESISSYLSKLAAKRNIILSHNQYGSLVYYRYVNTNPKYSFNQENTLSMSLSVNGQSLHSKISMIRQPGLINNSLKPLESLFNILVRKYKPLVKVLTNGDETDVSTAVNNVLASELNNISINIELNYELNINPGDAIEVVNPEIYLYSKTKLIVSYVTYKQTKDSNVTNLSLVIPESFNGNIPKNIFA